MKHGDFTELAKFYINRPSYGNLVVKTLLKIVDFSIKKNFKIVEIGAGTGKFTKIIAEMGLNIIAIEPNEAMLKEGKNYTKNYKNINWLKGNAEKLNLNNKICDWVIMASSFHWTNPNKSLPEIYRILKDTGYFTAIWNSRNIKSSDFHMEIEENIKRIVPNLKRVSSGIQNTKKWEEILVSTGHFKECIFVETDYQEHMTRERYLGVWKSVNDIRVQAGEKKWNEIIEMLEDITKNKKEIMVPYKIRAWTVKKIN